MYAVFEDGSRQYRVSEGDVVRLDYRDAEPGARMEFKRVLLYQGGTDLKIGQPLVEGATVVADVVDHPSIKVYIQKFRRRKNSIRLKGHRQPYIAVQVAAILLPGQTAPPPKEKKVKPESGAEAAAPETTPPATPATAPETPPTPAAAPAPPATS
jgi:large subunit ribosomal protein L21